MSAVEIRPETAIGRAVGMTAKAFRQSLDSHLADSGEDITVDQFIALMNLLYHDGMCHQEVAEVVDRDKTGTTRIVDGLERRGLVTRVTDETDRRLKKVCLTKEGRDACRRLRRVAEKTQRAALAGIDDESLSVCRKVLEQIRKNLNER